MNVAVKHENHQLKKKVDELTAALRRATHSDECEEADESSQMDTSDGADQYCSASITGDTTLNNISVEFDRIFLKDSLKFLKVGITVCEYTVYDMFLSIRLLFSFPIFKESADYIKR